jgi:hypothetical protein
VTCSTVDPERCVGEECVCSVMETQANWPSLIHIAFVAVQVHFASGQFQRQCQFGLDCPESVFVESGTEVIPCHVREHHRKDDIGMYEMNVACGINSACNNPIGIDPWQITVTPLVPAASEWGLVVFTLGMLAGGHCCASR